MARDKIRLNLDLDALLPGDNFTIGQQTIIIRPLGLFQYKLIVGKLRALADGLKEKGVTFQNYNTYENLFIIAETLIIQFPEILEEVSGIAQEDLEELPLDVTVALVERCIDVNMKSKESLMGNWNSLLARIKPFLKEDKKEDKKEVKDSPKSSKS